FLVKILGGQGHQFFHVCLAGSQHCGQDLAPLSGDLVAVGAGDFLNDSVRSQPCQGSRDTTTLAAQLSRIDSAGIEAVPQVPISKAAQGPLASVDEFEQGCILGRPRVEGSIVASVLLDRAADGSSKG